MASPAIPGGEAAINKYLAKDEYKTLAWMGSMAFFGFLASCGGSSEAAPAEEGGDGDFEALLKELESAK